MKILCTVPAFFYNYTCRALCRSSHFSPWISNMNIMLTRKCGAIEWTLDYHAAVCATWQRSSSFLTGEFSVEWCVRGGDENERKFIPHMCHNRIDLHRLKISSHQHPFQLLWPSLAVSLRNSHTVCMFRCHKFWLLIKLFFLCSLCMASMRQAARKRAAAIYF